MDQQQKLTLLSTHNDLEMPEPQDCVLHEKKKYKGIYVSHATLPNGKRMRLFKSLISSRCKNNCYYCPMRKDSNLHRASFEPEEYARIIDNLYKAGLIDGAFISSAVDEDSIKTQDRLIKAMEILRLKLKFKGYLHVKFMPGLEFDQAKHIMHYADRVSLNLEAPNENRIKVLSPDKTVYSKLLDPLRWTQEIRQSPPTYDNWQQRWPSVCTQFVVGGSDETDLEILQTTTYLYKQIGLQRTYFSPLSPSIGTPMEDHPAIPIKRKTRLYQASYLIRDYGYKLQDLRFSTDANLPLDKDPKLIWAEVHLQENPIEVNRADLEQLLKIPGIGRQNAHKILTNRKNHPFRDVADFSKVGIRIKRGLPFILMDGKRPILQPQLPFESLS